MAQCESGNSPLTTAEFASDFKQREEAKRERLADPLLRWQTLMKAIAWTEQLPTVRCNSREECLRRQAKLLKGLAESQGATAQDEVSAILGE